MSEQQLTLKDLKAGDKVRYQPFYCGKDHWKNGIVKEIPSFATDPNSVIGYNCVRVVYNCGGDWKHYHEYTSALTRLGDLKKGWR
jgi:hypothetical protein